MCPKCQIWRKEKWAMRVILNIFLLLIFHCSVLAKTTFLEKTDLPLANPYKGIYTQVSNKISRTLVPQSLAYSSFTWRELEPTKRNQFKWKKIEKDWKWHTDKGRNIVIRFKIADPWSSDDQDYPVWLDTKGIKKNRYFIDGGTGVVPDWDSETFLIEHERIIIALGKRYDKDPRIAWVEVGSYGNWGEWHMFENEMLSANLSSKFRIMNSYIKAFPSKKLVMPFDDIKALNYMVKFGVGIRNDCLGTPDSNRWFSERINKLSSRNITEIAKKSFIVGEFCGGEDGARKALALYPDENFDFIKKNHSSSIGPAGGNFLSTRTEVGIKLHKTLGYRFVLEHSEINESIVTFENLQIILSLKNEGVAPFYYDWRTKLFIKDGHDRVRFEYYVLDDGWSAKSWISGDHRLKTTIPIAGLNLPPGSYSIYLGIEDPNTLKSRINFANSKHDKQHRYFVGSFVIRDLNEK